MEANVRLNQRLVNLFFSNKCPIIGFVIIDCNFFEALHCGKIKSPTNNNANTKWNQLSNCNTTTFSAIFGYDCGSYATIDFSFFQER